jgi:glucose-1-phosphate cytidylyltransferase
MKTIILCGGLGTRLREETEYKPKPMVEIGGRPILWHIMKRYAAFGHKDFILCLGYKGEVIKDYFYNYQLRTSDVTVTLGRSQSVEFHNTHPEEGWKVTLVETGANAMTGARIKRAAKHLGGEPFMLTYGDGVADVDIPALLDFHKKHGRIATVTGVHPPSRFGELVTQGERVLDFSEKPQTHQGAINGGFFVMNPAALDYLADDDACILEKQPLENLAREGELMVYQHKGFWQCMDTFRDLQLLNKLWDSGEAPWRAPEAKEASR